MIFQRSLRQQTGLRAVSSSRVSLLSVVGGFQSNSNLDQHALRTQSQVRRAHHVPQLTHHATFTRNGIPDVLSPEGFDLAWTQYQATLVGKLNLLTAGKPAAVMPC